MAVMITTKDNPYNPLKDYDKWLQYDMAKGYNTNAYLARIAATSEKFSEIENEKEIEWAIDDIILNDPMNIYRKVVDNS